MSKLDELKPDKKNFNKHTEYGMSLLEKSLNKFGAGRSILVDKDNNIIAGNGIVEAAAAAGLTKTKVVETTGDELVVVKRTDVKLDSAQGREMALADNATAAADLEWDFENMNNELPPEAAAEWVDNFKTGLPTQKELEEREPTITASFITVDFSDEVEIRVEDETARELLSEMVAYRGKRGNYDGFWDERLKR